MKKLTLMILLSTIYLMVMAEQNLTQTVRGKITDTDSKLPLIGVSVVILNSNPITGTTTDNNGYFRLENIPVGRISLQFTYMGYENKTLPNVVVNSGKEVVIEISLQESILKLDEVIVTAQKRKGEVTNDMAFLSARSISLDETSRYTGGMNDPSRVVTSFAGVASTPEGSSDIIVRGNSPKYMQWYIDGIEITSPYHFDDQNASYGALTALNNSLLATSDFYTGAFPAEYGNVLSSVFDVKLRNGNNEKFEATAGIGILGTDLTFEGPVKKGYSGSYLLNYRYSTVSLIQDIGLIDVEGILRYQDVTFKIVLPSKKLGTFSMFGLGGLNGFTVKNQEPGNITVPGTAYNANISKDYKKSAYLANLGLKHTLSLGQNSFIQTSLSYSANGFNDDVYDNEKILFYNTLDEIIGDSLANRYQTLNSDILNSSYRISLTYHTKINAKNKIEAGSKIGLQYYMYNQNMFNPLSMQLQNVNDFNVSVSLINNYINWKYQLNNKISFLSGLHTMYVALNNKSTLEPRIAVNIKLDKNISFQAGYGKHSTMEKIQHYFTNLTDENGIEYQPNKNMDLLKSDHYVVGIEKRFMANIMAKIEFYYQYLYDIPVENNDSSMFSTINEGINYKYVDLVNQGKGKNYGVEITLERFFSNQFYYLFNTSIFNSTYVALDGIKRNTQYNGKYLVNMLCGKEFSKLGKKQNKILAINAKLFYGGGKKYIPLLRDENGEVKVDTKNNKYWDYSNAYEKDLDDVFYLNFSVSYKINNNKSTHEIFLDLMNVTDNRARLGEFYDESKPGKVGYTEQIFFFPNLMYRVYF